LDICHSTQVLTKLKLIQDKLYYYKQQFHAWGYYHYDCCWTPADEIFFNNLFPEINFKQIDIVVWYNHEALNFYLNKFKYSQDFLHKEIIKQLKLWNKNR
jgi:hypothetical protein